MTTPPKEQHSRATILALREAYVKGWWWGHTYGDSGEVASERAAKEFPLPRITRPRVVRDEDGGEWRWTPELGLQFRFPDGPCPDWREALGRDINKDHDNRLLIADLLADPTEEVEDDS